MVEVAAIPLHSHNSPHMALNKTILKEFKDTNYKSFAEDQISVHFPDEADLTKVGIILTPNDGVYQGARIKFSLDLTTGYPNRSVLLQSFFELPVLNSSYCSSVPIVRCDTLFLHPNIQGESICLNIFDGGGCFPSLPSFLPAS